MTPAATAGTRGPRASAMPPDERRRAIVDATLPLVLRDGPNVTTRQIADAAGIAEGTIFRAFADKDELLAAVVQAALDPAPLQHRLARIDATQPLEDRLVEAVAVLQQRSMAIWQLIAALGPKHRPDRRAKSTLPGVEALVALIGADAARLRIAPDAAARYLRALTIATGHPALSEGRPLPAAEVVSLFLDGVGAPAPGRRRR